MVSDSPARVIPSANELMVITWLAIAITVVNDGRAATANYDDDIVMLIAEPVDSATSRLHLASESSERNCTLQLSREWICNPNTSTFSVFVTCMYQYETRVKLTVKENW